MGADQIPDSDVIILGGGLSGLRLASLLHHAGLSFQLFEARPLWGGRIAVLAAKGGRVDLGPSWFWPGQRRIERLVEDLGLKSFDQHAEGDILFETAAGVVQRGAGFGSMEGSLRVEGGTRSLIEGLVARLPAERLHLSHKAVAVGDGTVQLSDGTHHSARHVVLALPPRLAATLMQDASWPDATRQSLAAIPTWMAGHAKFVAVYARPFWRDAGLSGDAISRFGPLAEIHDASGADGRPAALFGFLGVPAKARAARTEEITAQALVQLARLFGPDAARPVQTALQDWAREPLTATAADQTPPLGHPAYGLPRGLSDILGHRLHLCATETAPDNGGLMEGALAAAEHVARQILGAKAA
ncbi:flavin monoamine oxidase family protein [Roseicyclus mahoneyensis]|uniref:Putative NAD(P)-binding protein n=1 Tax=Roseicyclus mahoneyensis TaxID=164332 RepID=A0A316GSY6_9RHOB|nr:NAD(P)/FAD-dependent oxidoreductase [Roseicyclus mahoneyensis]PWK58157.1 putative NAD(P)-binding protein [Roseicyclus mahoneyensis]